MRESTLVHAMHTAPRLMMIDHHDHDLALCIAYQRNGLT
jgi:hypothetical protein